MKIVTRQERVGENLGPIDWSWDFTKHDWTGGRGGVNPECTKSATELLRQVEQAIVAGRQVSVRMYDTFEPVVDIGMYDGWPFWVLTPSVLTSNFLGCSWHPWYSIREVAAQGNDAATWARKPLGEGT